VKKIKAKTEIYKSSEIPHAEMTWEPVGN